MSNNRIKVSLISTLYNEVSNIGRFLESYQQQTLYADEFIIVDGGSDDGTIEQIQQFSEKNPDLNIRLIIDTSCTKKYVTGAIAKGRNRAIEECVNNYIAVTDAGCVLDEHWLEELIEPFVNDESKVDVVSGWYKPNIKHPFQKIYADLMMPKVENIVASEFLPSSRSLAFKKDCWEKVEGYPIESYTAEDTKFDLDLKDIGCRFTFAEKAFVFWDCPMSLQEAKQKHYSYAYGDGVLGVFMMKYLIKFFFLFFPVHLLLGEKRAFFSVSYSLFLSAQLGFLAGTIHRFQLK